MKTDVFHKYIASKFIEQKEEAYTNLIKRKLVRKILYLNHVPCVLHNIFLKEMEAIKLIKLKDKRNIEILQKIKL